MIVSGCSPVAAQCAKRAAPSAAPNSPLAGIVKAIFKTVAITSNQYRDADPPPIAIRLSNVAPVFAQGLIAVAQTERDAFQHGLCHVLKRG